MRALGFGQFLCYATRTALTFLRAFYDQNGQVKVILDEGEHPCRFTVQILRNLTVYGDALTDAINNADPTITILNVRQEIFDMAMQVRIIYSLN